MTTAQQYTLDNSLLYPPPPPSTPPLTHTGPEKYPWDHTHGYASVLGIGRVFEATFAGFAGGSAEAGSCLAGTYALANHIFAPDAAHPQYLRALNLQSVAKQGLFLMTSPDPKWRNEADCGEANLTRSDGSVLPLNCAGGGAGLAGLRRCWCFAWCKYRLAEHCCWLPRLGGSRQVLSSTPCC